ncbi:MAG: hypothetical protein ACRD9Q_08095 [Nitrososphaeraceae archaeon]
MAFTREDLHLIRQILFEKLESMIKVKRSKRDYKKIKETNEVYEKVIDGLTDLL